MHPRPQPRTHDPGPQLAARGVSPNEGADPQEPEPDGDDEHDEREARHRAKQRQRGKRRRARQGAARERGRHLTGYLPPGAPFLPRAALGAVLASGDMEEDGLVNEWADDDLLAEPGSRAVSNADVRRSEGEARTAWYGAAEQEVKESFERMGAVTISYPCRDRGPRRHAKRPSYEGGLGIEG